MKTLTFMNVKGQELTREEMRNVMAGCGGSGGNVCRIYRDPSAPGWGGWSDCMPVDEAQSYYNDGSFQYITGYCCASCSNMCY
jgi:hypothetical protein